MFLLDGVDSYTYLSSGNIVLPGVDDAVEFRATIDAMKVLGFDENEITGEWK